MMVNEIKNTDASWQSTIPQQMPWMSSYEPTSFNMQFGQQPLTGIGSNIIGNPTDPHLLMQQQHPSMASFPTATTLTLPVTVCPTTFAANSLLSSSLNAPQIGVTTTTQSYPLLLNSGLPANLDLNHTLLNQNTCQPIDRVQPFSPINSLTHMSSTSLPTTESYHKRSSIEMEDDQIKALEPPTKQLLSESKLFRRFGSLHLDGAGVEDSNVNNQGSDESEDEQPDSVSTNDKTQSREEFNRYVYLLFKDKKGDGMSFAPTNNTLDRLAREERDKLNKAVVLWSPRNKLFEPTDEDDEDEEGEFKYSDHTDFLKKPSVNTITISEVNSDSNNDTVIAEVPLLLDSDDVMLE